MQFSIYISDNKDRFFRIPESVILEPGETILFDLDGNRHEVDSTRIEQFETPKEVLIQQLRFEYDESVNHTKRCLTTLTGFAAICGETEPYFLQQLTGSNPDTFSDMTAPFAFGKELVEELLFAQGKKDATPEEQQQDFKKIVEKIPELLKYFDDENLQQAALDPETWANEMHKKMFGDQDNAKKNADIERLKREVQESIANGLRSAGIEPIPSEDTTD